MRNRVRWLGKKKIAEIKNSGQTFVWEGSCCSNSNGRVGREKKEQKQGVGRIKYILYKREKGKREKMMAEFKELNSRPLFFVCVCVFSFIYFSDCAPSPSSSSSSLERYYYFLMKCFCHRRSADAAAAAAATYIANAIYKQHSPPSTPWFLFSLFLFFYFLFFGE